MAASTAQQTTDDHIASDTPRNSPLELSPRSTNPAGMAGFSDMPEEIILIIVKYLRWRHVARLALTSRNLYHLLIDKIYSHNVLHRQSWALAWAASRHRLDTARRMLAAGADPMGLAPKDGAASPLSIAAKFNSDAVAKLLCESDAVRSRAHRPCTRALGAMEHAVSFAAENHNPELLGYLLACQGVDYAKEYASRRALGNAARKGASATVKLLLRATQEAGVNPFSPVSRCNSALADAAFSMTGNVDVMRLLLADPRVDTTHSHPTEGTALHIAAGRNRRNTRLLLRHGFDVNSCSEGVGTPLHAAIMHRRASLVRLLLATPEIDPNVVNEDGCTPFIMAARIGHVEIATILSEDPRVLPNVVADDGETALISVMKSGKPDVMPAFLKHPDTDVNYSDMDGLSALHYAIRNPWSRYGNRPLKLLLEDSRLSPDLRTGVNEAPIPFAAKFSHSECDGLMMLCNDGRFAVDAVDGDGRNALSYAVEKGHPEFAKFLLDIEERREDVDFHVMDKYRKTPYMYGAIRGRRYGESLWKEEKNILSLLEKFKERGRLDLDDWGSNPSETENSGSDVEDEDGGFAGAEVENE